MAKNTIKGLTVEIGGDTTKLGQALENVNKKSSELSSELGEVNRLLKFDPGNADLLAQKQQILANAIDNTSAKLKTLKEAERQVQQQFERGEVSEEQVRALQREIAATEQKLKSYKRAVQETADATEDLGQESAEASAKMADVLGKGLNVVAGLSAAAVTGLTAAAESSRDYRAEMGKLNTAFAEGGFSTEAATGAYKELVGILGETDQSVEAANHLAKLTDNEKDLAHWTGSILPGVFATFGDSLPIEGLTEAANETAKVGQVTGPLADALNWAGVSEEAFNESLEKCTTEQERQALITETLVGLYGQASETYKTTNADVIAANQANDNLAASTAKVGETVEPLLTKVKDLGATLLETFVPVIDGLLNNLPALAVAIGGVTAAKVALKIATIAAAAAEKDMTLIQYAAAAAQKALNAAMAANPIGLIILLITSLVTAFMLLWNNCEGFRNFWKKLWEGIKKAVVVVVDWFKKVPGIIWNAIQGAVPFVKKWGSQIVSQAKTAATNMLNSAANTLKNLPSRIWNAIVGAVQNIAKWGQNMASKARSAMSNVATTVTNKLKEIPGKVVSVGADLVTGLWNGIKDKFQWLKDKLSGFANSVLDGIKNFFGVHSPSTETAWMGEMLTAGLAKGINDNAGAPLDAMSDLTDEMLAQEAVNGLNLDRKLSATFSPEAATNAANSGLLAKLDNILAAIQRGQVIMLDGEALVGSTLNNYDNKLGQRRALAARGAL